MKYSIITPVFNREDCIARCLESVISNLGSKIDCEHIVVDDGSSDRTVEILKKYEEKYSHIVVLQHLENRGTNAARNKAISVAKGEFCVLLDSDDCFIEDALVQIDEVVSSNKYKEYMFAASDMADSYANNSILNKGLQSVIKYEDFLSGRVSGDFVHCVSTNIMQKYPFREDLRIYEGIFFLQFYREAKEVLFSNIVITNRERRRSDRVTRDTIRISKEVIRRRLDANLLQINLFESDFRRFGMTDYLDNIRLSSIDNALLLSNYDYVKKWKNSIQGKKAKLLKIIYFLRLGSLYRLALYFVLHIKYDLLGAEIK